MRKRNEKLKKKGMKVVKSIYMGPVTSICARIQSSDSKPQELQYNSSSEQNF